MSNLWYHMNDQKKPIAAKLIYALITLLLLSLFLPRGGNTMLCRCL